MILHRSLTYFLFVLNFHIGLLLQFLPENREDVIYFSQNQLRQWQNGGKVDDGLVKMNRHVSGDEARGHGGGAPDVDHAAPAAKTVHLPAAFISGGQDQEHERNARAATADEGNCGVSGDKISRIINNKFHFSDSNFNLALLWTGPDSKELLALTTLEMGIFAAQSHLWLSVDYGKTFTNIDDRIEGAIIRRQNGIFKSPLDPQRVVLISYLADNPFGTKLYLSKNGGRDFTSVTLDFVPEGKINFHPTHKDLMFVTTPNNQHKLWLSRDFGLTWTMLKANIEQATWASPEMHAGNDLFMLQYEKADEESSLLKTSNLGKSYQTLQRHVQNFGLKGKFIYAAIEGGDEQHVLHVSIDKGHTWSPTQLPVITSDRFFSVLDASEGLIFMHVDDPGNTGTGTIYTSSSDGIVFSESLEKHLFPNQQFPDDELTTDFYRVDSMRGVYLASTIHPDETIHTVITYDRGGIWSPIKKPDGLPCDDTGECNLQIHNQYSQKKHINVPSGPISHSTATGLILAHGTVANGLELRPPDVFVSSDGGYTWRQALAGPHHYAITNSGGLLLAIPASEQATNIIKFSYDEGHCWNSFQFSEESIRVTGLLPEPSRKSLNVSIWGFGSEDSEWRSFMIDFGAILERECTAGDFVEWKPHEANDQGGCLLGLKESFRRIRPDSLCRVSFNFEQEPISSEHCQCVKADYECDYGFYRPENSEECHLSSQFQNKELEVCKYGHEEELKTWGYRKIPGDVCEGGYQPERDVEKLKAKCGDATGSSNSHAAALGVVITLLVLLLLGLLFILYRKKKFMCLKNGLTKQYQYNVLSQGDAIDSEALDLMNNSVQSYHDDSDEDMLE